MHAAIFCPAWSLAPHRTISSIAVSIGTVMTASCDEGFMFANGSLVEAVECVSVANGEDSHAEWNSTQLYCQRE